MCSDELVPGDPQLENDSGPAAIGAQASQVLMKTGILQITPKTYIILNKCRERGDVKY